jgi:hypothetical protein
MSAELLQWPVRHIVYHVDHGAIFGTLPCAGVLDAFGRAWRAWESVCGLTACPGSLADAHVLVQTQDFGSPWGLLATSEMPDGSLARRRQLFNSAALWSLATTRDPWKVELYWVAMHEIGHVLGIGDHLPPGNVMALAPDFSLRCPQAGDVREVVARYGPRSHESNL